MRSNDHGPWAGVDVGGRRKGFDVAVANDERLLALARCATPADVLRVLGDYEPLLVAIDSPCAAAPSGATLRECERALQAAVCGIRWTPDQAALDSGNPYYEWIRLGLDLYRALEAEGLSTIEVFPTASWTRWTGTRRGSRAAWTKRAMTMLGLEEVPAHTNQDVRDAIAAAVTARQQSRGETDAFGPIVVPKAPGPVWPASQRRVST